jgi:DNA uptake protein ComE-like DNA-binding protein
MSAPIPACVTPAGRACLGAATALLAIQVAGWCRELSARSGPPISAAQLQLRLDPNKATAAELDLLPRVGEKIAANIVAYRESVSDAPAFGAAEDLAHVPRIGPVTVELLRPHLRFSSAADGAPESPTP